MDKDFFTEGIELLQQPVMPLVSMVQFLFMTGPFTTVAEVIDELPAPIETDRAVYNNPKELLEGYLEILTGLEQLKQGGFTGPVVIDEQDNPVDLFSAGVAVVQQRMLETELERINSALCGPCGCVLCCVGPDATMEQEFFEIPLEKDELDLFPVKNHDNEASRSSSPLDDAELQIDGQPFYKTNDPELFHWQKGWSLILPKGTKCPNLNDNGQCQVYIKRPMVCRRPQIFPYMLEQVKSKGSATKLMRFRQSLLAITDCPYVKVLQDEIAEYAAACELHLVFKQNKQ